MCPLCLAAWFKLKRFLIFISIFLHIISYIFLWGRYLSLNMHYHIVHVKAHLAHTLVSKEQCLQKGSYPGDHSWMINGSNNSKFYMFSENQLYQLRHNHHSKFDYRYSEHFILFGLFDNNQILQACGINTYYGITNETSDFRCQHFYR